MSGATRSPTRCDVRARGHTITIDEAEARRGTDGVERVDKVFPEIDLAVDCRMRGPPDDPAPIRHELRERRPVSVAPRCAGREIREVWHVAR